MRRTIVSGTDYYRFLTGQSLTRSEVRSDQRAEVPEAQEPEEDIYMTDFEETTDDDLGAWVSELEERRANVGDPFASLDPPASDDPEFDEMVAHRTRFERAALAAERAKRPDFGRSVGDVPSLTRAEHQQLWESTKRDDIVGDLSWLER